MEKQQDKSVARLLSLAVVYGLLTPAFCLLPGGVADLAAQQQELGGSAVSDQQARFEAATNYGYSAEGRPKAVEILRKLVEEDPSNNLYRLELARNLAYLGLEQEALAQFDKLPAAVVPAELQLIQARLYEKRGRSKAAAEIYQRLLDTDAHKTNALLGLARCAHMQKDYAAAKQYYSNYLHVAGKKASAAEFLEAGTVLCGIGSCPAGISILERGSKLYPSDSALNRELGLQYAWLNNLSAAVPLLETAQKDYPRDRKIKEALLLGYAQEGNAAMLIEQAQSSSDLGVDAVVSMLLLQGKDAEAVQLVNHQLKTDPQALQARVELSRALEQLGRYYQAERLLLAVQDKPQGAQALAQLYQRGGRTYEAEQLCPVLEQPANKPAAKAGEAAGISGRLDRAYNQLAAGEYAAAEQLFSTIIAERPITPAYLGRAESYLAMGLFESAERDAAEVLSRHPEHRQSLLISARTESYRANYPRAIGFYQRLYTISETDPVTNFELAQTQLWAGNREAYQTAFTRIKSNDPRRLELEAFADLLEGRHKQSYQTTQAGPAADRTLAAQAACAVGLYQEAKEALKSGPATATESFAHRLFRGVERRLSPELSLGVGYWKEEGTSRAADVERLRFAETRLSAHLGGDFNVVAMVTPIEESFELQDSLNSIEGLLAFDWQADEAWSIAGQFAGQSYDESAIDDRLSGTLGIWYRFSQPVRAGLRYARANEAANYFAIAEDVQSDRLQLIFDGQQSQRFVWSFLGEYVDYSDDNNGSGAAFNARQRVYNSGVEMWLTGLAEYRDSDELSRFDEEGSTAGAVVLHPYWTPDSYFSGWLGFMARRSLRTTTFCEESRYVEAGLRGNYDSEDNAGVEFTIGASIELTDAVTLGLHGLVYRSDDWDADSALLRLSYAF